VVARTDTIFLDDGSSIPVDLHLISKWKVYFRQAGDSSERMRFIPMKYIKRIRYDSRKMVTEGRPRWKEDVNEAATTTPITDFIPPHYGTLSVLSLFLSSLFIGVVLGFIALIRIKKYPNHFQNREAALLGVILGLAGTILLLIIVSLFLIAY